MSFGSFYYGKNGFLFKKNTGVGNRRNPKIGLICNQPQDVNNTYVAGSGVGGSSVATRRAKKYHATVCGGLAGKCKKNFYFMGMPIGVYPVVPVVPVVPDINPCTLLPKDTPYQECSPWPHLGGIFNNNSRLSPFLGSQTGKLKWKFSPTEPNESFYGSPAIASDGTIYIGSGGSQGYVYAIQ